MKKLVAPIFFSTFLLLSCSGEKTYEYVEHTNIVEIDGKSRIDQSLGEDIKASNDFEAYCKAFKKFVVAQQKSREEFRKSDNIRTAPILLLFTLHDKDSVQITETVLGRNPELVKDSLFAIVYPGE